MRDQLLGYLLGALDDTERAAVEQRLQADPRLREDLALLRASLDVLQHDDEQFEPPRGLSDRTVQFVFDHTAVTPASLVTGRPSERVVPTGSRWTFADLTVAAGIAIAAAMLFFPAVNQSRAGARLAGCQNNLRQIYTALAQYSDRKGDGYFPAIPAEGNLAAAGSCVTVLAEEEYLPNARLAICPDSPQAQDPKFVMPRLKEVLNSTGAKLAELQKRMGGSYAYPLGYYSKAHQSNISQAATLAQIMAMPADQQPRVCQGPPVEPVKNQRRKGFAVLADAPARDFNSGANHWKYGANVVLEDGRVVFRQSCKLESGDNIYLNDANQVAPGLHINDSVLGASGVNPHVVTVSLDR